MIRFVPLLFFCVAAFSLNMAIYGQQDSDPQPDFFVEVSVSDDIPYVGQQIDYIFRQYAYLVPEQGLVDDLPDFGGFWLGDVIQTAQNRVVTVGNRQYVMRELIVQLVPLQTGDLSVGPATLIVPGTVFRDQLRIESDEIRLQVKPLPEPVPENYTGAVGQFFADASVDRTSVTLGEPVLLTMTITGSGNLEQSSRPQLNLDGWRVFPNSSSYVMSALSGVRLNERRFDWLLIPEMTGTLTLEGIDYTYFDAQQETFRTTSGPTFSINVFPGVDNVIELPAAGIAANVNRLFLDLMPVPASLSIKPEHNNSLTLFWWLIAPLIALGSWGALNGKRMYAAYAARKRQERALDKALLSLERVGSHSKDVGTIVSVIEEYVADRLTGDSGVAHEFLHHEQIQPVYRNRARADGLQALRRCYFQAQSLQYAPPDADHSIQRLINETKRILRAVDGKWSVT